MDEENNGYKGNLDEFAEHMKKSISKIATEKLQEMVFNGEFGNRLENFVFVELQAKGGPEGPLTSIKNEYINFLYKLKSMMLKKNDICSILSSFFDFSMSVFRTLIKSVRGYNQRKTSNILIQMASMNNTMNQFKKSESRNSKFGLKI